MSTFKIYHDDTPDAVTDRITSVLREFGIQVSNTEGGDGYMEYKVSRIIPDEIDESGKLSDDHRQVIHNMLDGMLAHLEQKHKHKLICKIALGTKEVSIDMMRVRREPNGEMFGVIAVVPEHQFDMFDGMTILCSNNLDTK